MELKMIRTKTEEGHIYGQIRTAEKWIADTDELISFSVITSFEDILCSHLADGIYYLQPVFMADENKTLIGIYDSQDRMRSAFVQDNKHKYRGVNMWNENGRIEIGCSDNLRQLKERARVYASFYALVSNYFHMRKKITIDIQTLNDCNIAIKKFKTTQK